MDENVRVIWGRSQEEFLENGIFLWRGAADKNLQNNPMYSKGRSFPLHSARKAKLDMR